MIKKKILKAARERTRYYRARKMRTAVYFRPETRQKAVQLYLSSARRKNLKTYQPTILYPVKVSANNKGEIHSFSDI